MTNINLSKSRPNHTMNLVREIAKGLGKFLVTLLFGAVVIGLVLGTVWTIQWVFSHENIQKVFFYGFVSIMGIGFLWCAGAITLYAIRSIREECNYHD